MNHCRGQPHATPTKVPPISTTCPVRFVGDHMRDGTNNAVQRVEEKQWRGMCVCVVNNGTHLDLPGHLIKSTWSPYQDHSLTLHHLAHLAWSSWVP